MTSDNKFVLLLTLFNTDPQQIPNEWLQKLDGLKLQDLIDQSLRSAKRNFEMDQQ